MGIVPPVLVIKRPNALKHCRLRTMPVPMAPPRSAATVRPYGEGLGVGAFAEFTVLPASGAVRIDPDIPLDVACVIGCAMQTGMGAVFNTAQVQRGATVVVMGLGGIGQAIVSGAVVAGASRIVVSDPAEGRREMASNFGATDLIDPTSADLVSTVMDLTGGQGADYAFDAVGSTALVEQGINSTRVGGTTVMVGASPIEENVTINAAVLFMTLQKRLLGCLLGACWPTRDIPLMLDLWRTGRLDLERMINHRLPLSERRQSTGSPSFMQPTASVPCWTSPTSPCGLGGHLGSVSRSPRSPVAFGSLLRNEQENS